MDRRKILLFTGALLVAVITMFAARSMFSSKVSATVADTDAPIGAKVLVATRDLPAGTRLTLDATAFRDWPKDRIDNAYYVEGEADTSELNGATVRLPIAQGQPLMQSALVLQGNRGFLAAVLQPGMRAVTIKVNDQGGVGGMVFPGDRIDLLLTQVVPTKEDPPFRATETIAENVRVLATDKVSPTKVVEGDADIQPIQTATLEVTPRIAEKIALAENIGTLSMTLRSLADNASSLERALASGSIKLPENATPGEEQRLLNAATSRPIDGASFVTGGDVSRYQRRNLPHPNQQDSMPSGTGVPSAMMGAMGSMINTAPRGPVVNVMRGHQVEAVAVGGR